MYSRKSFFKKLMTSGEVSDDEFVLFLLKYYFAVGRNIDDFQDDLTCEFDCTDNYSEACKESAKRSIKKFIMRYDLIAESWEQEQTRIKEEDY